MDDSTRPEPVVAAPATAVVARIMRNPDQAVTILEEWRSAITATVDTPDPCQMRHQPPMDFAYCETHDTTFPLGSVCEWDDVTSVTRHLYDLVDQQRVRAVRAEMERSTPAIDVAHLARQRAWSHNTFGPGPRTLGIVNRIRKELAEIEQAPDDLTEWADVIILGFDGAWRAGYDPAQIIDAIKAKQTRNEARKWPHWRTASQHEPIGHIHTERDTTDD